MNVEESWPIDSKIPTSNPMTLGARFYHVYYGARALVAQGKAFTKSREGRKDYNSLLQTFSIKMWKKAFARADWTKLDSKVRGHGDVHSFWVVSLYIDISILLWRRSYLSQAGTKLTVWLKMPLILLTLSLQWLDYKPLPACRFCGSYFLINEEAAAVNQLRVVWQHKEGTPMFVCFHLMALL